MKKQEKEPQPPPAGTPAESVPVSGGKQVETSAHHNPTITNGTPADAPDSATAVFKKPVADSRGVKTQTMGMKHSKSDHSGLSHKDKKKESQSSLGKKFISKSQDNLSGQKKMKTLAPVMESPRPRENAASMARAEATRIEKNGKDNASVKEKEKTSVSLKVKPAKPNNLLSNIRKTSSSQSIDRTSNNSVTLKSASLKSSSALSIKRAQSTQNVCKDNFMKKRTSAPADVMAYNAELLASFEKEKKILEVRISELAKVAENRKGEIEKYKYEIKRLKDQLSSDVDAEQLELLSNQNRQLLDRLQELGFPAEQITDSEKLMMKLSSAGTSQSQGSHSDICLPTSASCDSLATDGSGDRGGAHAIFVGAGRKAHHMGAVHAGFHRSASLSASEPGTSLPDLCETPDHPSLLSLDTANWDKQSSKSANSDGGLSEVSVACLTERILQMEETNYSTAEELQATLQELGDLQDAVNELTDENTKLTNEKAVLLESLCAQTEKLETTRIQLEHLKSLLISGELPDKSEKDIHLLGLLKSAQEEREELMRKQFEWSNALQALENECKDARDAEEILRDKFSLLEDANLSIRTEKDALERQLLELKDVQTAEQIELVRLRSLLDIEKNKVTELEIGRSGQDKGSLEAQLDVARQDKDRSDQKLADLAESLTLAQCEVTRLKEALINKEQELVVLRNSAKTQTSELQFRVELSEREKIEAEKKLYSLKEHMIQLKADCDKHLEDKSTLAAKLQEVQAELKGTKQQKILLEAELNEINSRHDMESDEWKQFQRDLQTAVVIANNLSQETQEKMEKLTFENSQLQERLSELDTELGKVLQENRVLRQATGDFTPTRHSILTNSELKGKVLSSMGRELGSLRDSHTRLDHRSQSISVKSLIRSIEEHVKSGCSSIHSSHSESRRSSTSSETSLKDLILSVSPLLATSGSPSSPTKDFILRTPSFKSSLDKSPQTKPYGGAAGVGVTSPEGAGKGLLGARVDSIEYSAGRGTPLIPSILKDRTTPKRSSGIGESDVCRKDFLGRDPLSSLAKLNKGSKRNALLKWCQAKTVAYSNVDITNFSSSWNDGLAFCALLHNYVPEKIPYSELTPDDKRKNFTIAFNAAESVGIKATLNTSDMVSMERPDWQAVMTYVTAIYRHFEVEKL